MSKFFLKYDAVLGWAVAMVLAVPVASASPASPAWLRWTAAALFALAAMGSWLRARDARNWGG